MRRAAFTLVALIASAAMGQVAQPAEAISLVDGSSVKSLWSVSADRKELIGAKAAGKAGLDVSWRVDQRSADCTIVELVARNKSDRDINVTQMEPLRCLRQEGSGFPFAAGKCLTNGYIYYDSGKLVDFAPGKPAKVESFWNAAFYQPEPRRVTVVGYVNNDCAEGRIIAERSDDRDGFDLTARSLLHPGFTLKPGESVSSGKVMVLRSDDPLGALERYADSIEHKRKLNPVINGWCSWFVYYGGVSETEVLKNAEFIARELKPCGMEWIQIDDGFYRALGDWEGNDRFPHGMKHAADEIKKLGLKPGLWIAPYCVGVKTELATKHSDWLVHDADGKLQKIEPAHFNQAQYILDITHPQAQAWLSNLVKTIAQDWGYRFIKTDFVEWTLLSAHRLHDPRFTKAQAYRLGDQIMRDAMGPEAHFLDCGPGNEVVGLIDSMRIGLDRPDDLPNFKLFNQYFGHDNSTAPSVAKRYYFHNRTWINDPDHLRLAKQSITEGQAAATIVALSGGTTISGDKLYELDADRLGILKKVLPSYGQSARPIDLFDRPQAELFALPVRTSFGNWTVVARFNPSEEAVKRRLDFESVELFSRTHYLAFDFWSQKLVADGIGGYEATIGPHSVCLVSIHRRTGSPQVIGTDRHVLGGAIELSDVRWDDASQVLSGVALGKSPMKWTLSVYVPSGYRFDPSDSAAATGLTEISVDGAVLRAGVAFEGATERVDWSLKFSKT